MDPERFKVNQTHQPVQAGIPDRLTVLPPSPPHHYSKSQKKNGRHYGWIWLAIVLAALILAGAGYLAIRHAKTTKPVKQSSSVKHVQSKPAAVSPPSIPSSSFTSPSFGMTFNYPQTWNVVDSGAAGVSVYSTPMTINNAAGQPVLAEVDVTFLKQGSLPSAFGNNTSVAVIDSQKIVFTQPGNNQPSATYISFVQYPSTTIAGGLDGVYVTGNFGYQKDQAIPNSQVAQVDPLIMVTFNSCSDSACSVATQKPLTIAATDWNSSSFSAPILLILSSLSFS